jgi:hypothetical protein
MSTVNLGTLTSTPKSYNDLTVTTADPTDVYKFTITGTSNINLSLNEISFNDDADLYLYRDSNGNGSLDRVTDTLVSSSRKSSNPDDAINVRANAGTYFAVVERFAPGSSGDVTYDLDLSATPPAPTFSPSNLLPQEVRVGDDSFSSLNQDKTFDGSVGDSNTADTYFFYLARPSGFPFGSDTASITLSGLSSDADIRLINDADSDRIVDAGEVVRSSTNGGTANEFIANIGAGNYYLQVYQYSGSTNYTVNFDYTYVPPA